MSYRCYVCTTDVTAAEHVKVLGIIEMLEELDASDWTDWRTVALDDNLGLVHCQGDPDQFDAESRVVVCLECLERGLLGTGLKEALDAR